MPVTHGSFFDSVYDLVSDNAEQKGTEPVLTNNSGRRHTVARDTVAFYSGCLV